MWQTLQEDGGILSAGDHKQEVKMSTLREKNGFVLEANLSPEASPLTDVTVAAAGTPVGLCRYIDFHASGSTSELTIKRMCAAAEFKGRAKIYKAVRQKNGKLINLGEIISPSWERVHVIVDPPDEPIKAFFVGGSDGRRVPVQNILSVQFHGDAPQLEAELEIFVEEQEDYFGS